MLRLLLIAVSALLIFSFLRRFFRAPLRNGGQARPARRGAAGREKPPPALDLTRDEKTGEYRVKDN